MSQYSFAYHEELEQFQMLQMTELFNSQMNMIMFPLVGEKYHLQVVLRDESRYGNSTVTVGDAFNLIEKVPNKLSPDSTKSFMGFEGSHSISSDRTLKQFMPANTNFPSL
ncbi:MAG: hypothetical protein OEQ12_01355 [Nitrosopumilus sp.]|nr:hypothetical protein [Nitrosopumilus sp.]